MSQRTHTNHLTPSTPSSSRKYRQLAMFSLLAMVLPLFAGAAMAAKEPLGRTLQQRKKRFLPCYERALKQTPRLEGRLAMSFVIAPNGAVKSARIAWSQLAHAGLHQCLLRELSGWRFATRPKKLKVTYPLHLTPGPAPAKKTRKLGRLKKGQIQRVVRQHIGDVERCYKAALKSSPRLKGKVTLSFVISAKGRVSSARIRRTSLKHQATQGCLIKVAMGWRFPRPQGNGIVQVSYPFTFTP